MITNAIYTLLDKKNKLIYVGEAVKQSTKVLLFLPAKIRVAIERMMIQDEYF